MQEGAIREQLPGELREVLCSAVPTTTIALAAAAFAVAAVAAVPCDAAGAALYGALAAAVTAAQPAAAVAALAAAAAAVAALAAARAALATLAAVAAAVAALAAAHAARLRPDRRGLLHDRERLLRRRPHLDRERVRGRRHGAWPVRQDRDRLLIVHKLVLSARLQSLLRQPLRLGSWSWLVRLVLEVHLQIAVAAVPCDAAGAVLYGALAAAGTAAQPTAAVAALAAAAAALAADVAALAALATLAAVAAVAAAVATRAANAARLRPDRRGLLHDQERLLRRRPHLDRARVRGRRHGARPVRQNRV